MTVAVVSGGQQRCWGAQTTVHNVRARDVRLVVADIGVEGWLGCRVPSGRWIQRAGLCSGSL
jgi:hypothetical protein